MSRKITAIDGVTNLPLPNGWNISAGDILVVSDDVWKQILSQDRVAANVKDMGTTADPITGPPSWRSVLRVGQGSPVIVLPAGQTYPDDSAPLNAVVLRRVS